MTDVLRRTAFLAILAGILGWVGCGDDDGGNGNQQNDNNGNQNAATFILSGTVSGEVSAGVTLTLSGSSTGTTTTDAAGAYAFTVTSGTYTVTPALAGYSFTPGSASATVTDADVGGLDFTSAAGSSSLGDRTDYDAVTLTASAAYASAEPDVVATATEYTGATADVPAIAVSSGGGLTLTHSRASKTGETASRENSGFYGFNSGVLASSSSQSSGYSGTGTAATVTMTDCTITTGASGANGAFAFGEDARVTLDHVTIVTTGSDNSRGVDATYGGMVDISNSLISTQGGSSAALATDRYDHTDAPRINATNVLGTTAGTGSPGIYCTGTFTVVDSTLIATGSEAAVVEGLNAITLENTSLSGADKWGVMIYQSMSGDSSVGTGSFSMTGGTLASSDPAGPMFFVCNTDAEIALTAATLVYGSDLLVVAGTAAAARALLGDDVNSSWGTRGGQVVLTATDQALSGEIVLCDGSSALVLTLTRSTYSGAINGDEVAATAEVTLDADSTWEVTGDSYLTGLTSEGTLTGPGHVYVDGAQVH